MFEAWIIVLRPSELAYREAKGIERILDCVITNSSYQEQSVPQQHH